MNFYLNWKWVLVVLFALTSSTANGSFCGIFPVATTELQTFQTPGFPVEYPSLAICTWTFIAPPGDNIKFTLLGGKSEECCDILTVYDGEEAYPPVSGDVVDHITYISTNGTLTIVFETDDLMNFKGFSGHYQLNSTIVTTTTAPPTTASTTRGFGYDANATSYYQEFITPGYPDIYPNSLTCQWKLKTPGSGQVRLVIISGRTESCCDKLEVYSEGVLLGEVSGAVLQTREFVSTNGELILVFRSDYTLEYLGLHGFFVLDKSYNNIQLDASEASQNITTPGFPYKYPKSASWNVVLTAPAGMQVELVVISGTSELCCDKLEIKSEGVLIGLVSGAITSPQRFLSTDEVMNIRFFSDSNLELEGFLATFNVVFGEESGSGEEDWRTGE